MNTQSSASANKYENRHAVLRERTVGGLHEFLATELSGLWGSQAHVLDVGCGTGAWLNRLADSGVPWSNLYGVDADKCQNAIPRGQFFAGNLDRMDWTKKLNRKFDLITAIEVIEHIENQGLFLECLAYLLKKNGTLVITTPNVSSLNARIKFALTGRLPGFDEKGDPTHIAPIYRTCLERILRRKKLYLSHELSFPRGLQRSRMYSPKTRILSGLLKLGIRDPCPGDLVIWLIHEDASAS